MIVSRQSTLIDFIGFVSSLVVKNVGQEAGIALRLTKLAAAIFTLKVFVPAQTNPVTGCLL